MDIFQLAGVTKNPSTNAWEFFRPPNHVEENPIKSIIKRRMPKRKQSVKWGSVTEILFSRSVGYVSIPNDGGYPLGLGELVEEVTHSIAEDFVPSSNKRSKSAKGRGANQSSTLMCFPVRPKLEPLSEKERIALLQSAFSSQLGSHSREVVQHNKDIKLVQQSRMNVGCSCKPIKAEKLNVGKLREMLAARCLNISQDELNNAKKAQLVAMLKPLLDNNSCCDSDCECAKHGISCNPRYCCCPGRTSIDSLSGCCNPFGCDNYDADEVQKYRQNILRLSAQSNSLFVTKE